MYKISILVIDTQTGKMNDKLQTKLYPPLFLHKQELNVSSEDAAIRIGNKVAGTIANFEAEEKKNAKI